MAPREQASHPPRPRQSRRRRGGGAGAAAVGGTILGDANAPCGVPGAGQTGKTLSYRFNNADTSGHDLGINKSGNGSLVLNGANKFGGSTYWDISTRGEEAEKP